MIVQGGNNPSVSQQMNDEQNVRFYIMGVDSSSRTSGGLIHATVGLESTVQSERAHTQKGKHCMMPRNYMKYP